MIRFAPGRRIISGVRLKENLVNTACLLINTVVLCVPAVCNNKKSFYFIFIYALLLLLFSGSSMEMSSADKQSTKLHIKSSAAASLWSLLSVDASQTCFHQQVVEHQARELACLASLPRGFTRHLRERPQQRGFQYEGPHPGSQTSSVPGFLWAPPFPVCSSPDGCHAVLLP